MGGVSEEKAIHELIPNHAAIERLSVAARDAEIAKLENPWIGQEGPLTADFQRAEDIGELLPRGIAFAGDTTVWWDEAWVRVLRMCDGSKGSCVAIKTPVYVHQRFHGRGADRLERVDFLVDGVYQGSHYRVVSTPPEEGSDA